MKIGIVSNLYPPDERGGAELVASRIADELYRRGHDIFVVSTEPFVGISSLQPRVTDQSLGRVYRFFPFNLYHLSQAQGVPLILRLLWHVIDLCSGHSARVLKRLMVNEEPDVMLTHNLKGIGLRTSKAIQKMGVRQIHTLHDVQLSLPSGLLLYGQEQQWMQTSLLRSMYEWGVKRAIGTPDVVISPSSFLMNFYEERGFFQTAEKNILPNPAPHAHPTTRDQRPDGPTRFVFVGQIEHHKGIELLLETLETVSFPFELHIAGDGALRPMVEAWAREHKHIHYHGFISLGHVLQLMEVCDAVVLPSLCYENSPTVIYEALQVGVPIVASNIGGINELIEHGQNGLLFTPGNKDGLYAALVEIEQKRVWFWDQASVLREQAKQFSIEHYVNELEKLFLP